MSFCSNFRSGFLFDCTVNSKFTIKDDCQKGIMIQYAYRSNYAIIGISLAMSISSGDIKPVVAASIISSVSIPLFNILATIVLSLYVKENGKKETIIL